VATREVLSRLRRVLYFSKWMWNDLRLGLSQALIQSARGFAACFISRRMVGGVRGAEAPRSLRVLIAVSHPSDKDNGVAKVGHL